MPRFPRPARRTSYGTGDDGALQKGVAWPTPRFTDNGNGTVTDKLTGLIWTEKCQCFRHENVGRGPERPPTVCKSGYSDLTDGSKAGDWRLPNVRELQSLVDYGRYDPALPEGHPFTRVQSPTTGRRLPTPPAPPMPGT